MNCSIPSLNKETLSLVSNLGEKYVLDYFRRKNLFSLPSLNELLKNNSIAFSEAKLKEIVSEFLPRNVFQVKHLDEIIANLPPATQAAFFKDVLYFGDKVTKEQIAEETFHAIFQRVIPPSMKQKYLKEGMSLINNIIKEKEAYLKSYPKALLLNETELEERVIEEAIAKRYVEYFNRNIIPSNKKGVLKLLENLFKWLKNLFNKLNNNANLEIFFDNIIKGNFSKSSVNDSNDSNVPTLRLIEYEYISEANNVLKRNLTVKESEFIISSIASIVIELNQKLTKEQAVNLKLTNRGNRIRFAIDKLRQHYEDKGDNPRFVSALSQHQEEKFNPDEEDYEKMFTLINLPNLKYLSEDVNNYLNIVTGSSLKNEEIEESEDDVASLDFSDNISANEKGFEGISAWLRSYIATTGKYIGKFEIEGKDISILSPIDKNKVYYSLARSMQNTTHELERLYKLVTIASFSSNKETRLLLDRVISDVIDTNEQDVNKRFESFKENITKLYSDWKSNKKENHYIINNIKGLKKDNVFILQTILQGFDLWKRDNNKIVIDIKSKSVDTKVFDANQNSATKAQMSMWEERWKELMVNPESKEEIRNKLLKLKSNFDNKRFTEDTVYDVIKLIFGNVEKTYIDYLLDSSTEKSIGGTFKPTASLEDVKIIFEKALFDTRSETKTPLMFDNTEGAVSRIEKLAVNTSKINEDVIESTYKDAENKTRYSYQNKTFQLYMFNEIFSEGGFEEYLDRIKKGELYEYGDGKFLQQASSFLYQTDNPELNHIVFDEQSRWKSAFLKGSYYSVDGLDVNNTGASTFGKMTSRDFLLWKLHLKSFRTKSNEKDEEDKVINYTQPIHINLMEAKRTSSFKEVLVIDDLFKKGFVTDKAIDLFEKEILKEVRRMFSEKPKIINWLEVLTKDEEDGEYKIKLTRKNVLENSDIDTAEGIIEKYHTGTYVIKKENGKITILEADARALQFTDNVKSLLSKKSFNNIITEVFNKENINEIDRNYKKEIGSQLNEYILEFKELVKSLKGLLPSSSRYNNLNIALPNDEFINDELSSWLNTIWVNQLLNSDSALLVKNDGADFVKRAGGQNAAIFSLATTFYSDLIPGIKNFDKINYVVGNDTEGVISFKPLTDDGKSNTVESSNAQSYTTVEAYIKYLYSISKLTKQASEILFKIKDGKVLTDEDIEYLKDNNMYFNVIKPVGYDGYFYFKTGTVMLTKDLTSYYDNVEKKWKAKPGKESLHNLREKMENSGVDYYLPQTASKQLTINKYTEEFDNLKYKEKEKDEIWNSSVNVMSTNFFGQQMENPAGKESIIDGSQMLEIILNEQNENVTVSLNGTKFSIGEMMKEWQRLSINRVEFSFQQALNEIADENLILQYNKFLDKVKETLINSGADDQLLEIFSLDENGQPKYNLNMSLSIDKFINLLMSHFSKGVLQQKVAGDAMALVSSHGFNSIKKVVKYKDEEGNDIYSWKYIRESDPEYKIALEKHKKSPLTNLTNVAEYDEFNGKNDSELTLKLKEIYKENEDVYFIDQLRFGKPVYAFNNEGIVTGVEYYGAESLMPNPKYKKNLPFEKLFAMFGIRIPSQDKHSAINLIWVDNIPSYYGNTVMCPKEIEYLSGSDYDIDKLYIHRKETFEKDGEEVVWSEEHNTFEMYKFYHTTKNKFIKNQINKLLETNEEYQDILKAIEVIKENYKEELENIDEYFNKTNQLIDKIISLLERKKKEKKESRKEGRDKVYNDNKEKINEEIRKEIIYLKQQARENVIVKSILEESNISELTQDDLTKLNKESQEDFENELKNLKKKFVNEKISNIIENEDEYSDLAKNLKTQETYLKGIITRLKNVKSEKFEFIKILTDLKELHERRKHIKSVVAHVVFFKNKLITSEEVFEKLKKEKGILIIPIINNKMLDLKIRFLMNEHTLNRTEDEAIALTPATQTNLKELIRQAYIIKDNKPYYLFKKVTKEKTSEGVEKEVYVDEFTTDVKHSTHSTLGQSTAHKNIVTGKRNIGVAVVGNLLHLFSKKADINLRSFITIEDITPYGKDGLHVLTETTLSNFNISKNVKLQRIADIISELISAATDEVKDQQNAKYGLTIEALNIVVPILMLGGSLDFAIRLVNTKGVREYLNKVDLKDNIAKTQDETEELSYSNEMILNNLFNSYKEKGYKTTPLSIVDLKEGNFEANALELAAKMLQISKEVGLAKYVISLKKGLGKTLEEFEDGEEKINSTTKEKLSDNHITTSALVFSKKNLNESLGIYKHQIKLHEYISELLNKNIISRREKFRKFKYLFLNNFKPATYDEAKNWMNDKMISFFYSRLYFSFLEKRNDFSENDFRNFTNKPLEEIEKEWKDFVSDVISGKANIKEELMKEIKQNPLLIKLKTNNQGRIYAPTFIKGDIATNISLLESYEDLHTKLSNTPYKDLMWKLFHYSIRKDGWTFKGGSLSKVIPPVFYTYHSKSLDMFLSEEDGLVENSLFGGKYTPEYLTFLAIERSVKEKEGLKYVRKTNSKQDGIWKNIYKNKTIKLSDLASLSEDKLTWLVDKGYIVISPERKIYPQFPLYHYFSEINTDTNKPENVLHKIKNVKAKFKDGNIREVTVLQYAYYYGEIQQVLETTYEAVVVEQKPNVISLPVKKNIVIEKLDEIKEIEQEQQSSVKGINIKKDKTQYNSLANRLTNPSEYSTLEYNVEPIYKENSSKFDVNTKQRILNNKVVSEEQALKHDMNLMYKLQVEKFEKHPELIDEINAKGGLEFIKNSSHIIGVPNSRWEGEGMNSNFIKVLAKSYEKVAKELGKFLENPNVPVTSKESNINSNNQNFNFSNNEPVLVGDKNNVENTVEVKTVQEENKIKTISEDYGIYQVETNPTLEDTQNIINLISPVIEKQAYKENVGKNANWQFSFGLMWSRVNLKSKPLILNSFSGKNKVESKIKELKQKGLTIDKNAFIYDYHLLDQDGNKLSPLSDLQPLINIIEDSIGIDMKDYDTVLGNIYLDEQSIAPHRDTTEDISARNYPIIVYTIGNKSGLGVWDNNKGKMSFANNYKPNYGANVLPTNEIKTKNGSIYIFGKDGKGRFELVHTTPLGNIKKDSFPPIKLSDGRTITNYTITLTFRRANFVDGINVPKKPSIIKEENKINQLSNSKEIYNQLENTSENVVIDEVSGRKPAVENQNYYEGNIKPEPNTIFVFGSNPEGRHGAGAAEIAKEQFGAIYGQGEGLQGNAYALPTKDLRVKENNGFKSISFEQIVKNIQKLYEVARQNPNKQFKIGYRNTIDKSLNGYTGLEMIEMFNQAGEIPFNIVFSKEWIDTGKITQSSKPIVAYRTRGNNFLEALEKDNAIGNPWNSRGYGLYKTNTVKEAVQEFISWMIGEKHTDKLQDYRKAIIDRIPEMKDKQILYYKDLKEPSHAIALDFLINKYNWNITENIVNIENTEIQKNENIINSNQQIQKKEENIEETLPFDNTSFVSSVTPALNFGFKNQKTKIIPQGSNPSNNVIFEDDDFVYLMNDQQQIAFNNIKNKIDEIFTKYSYLKSDEKATFNNSYLDAVYKGKVLKEMYDNMYGLQGSAGTGKSSLSKAIKKYITDEYPHKTLVFSAPTHKAATVLQESLGYDSEKVDEGNVFTNASLVGSTKENSDVFELSPDGNYFKRNKPKFGADIDVIIFDESSMIDVSFIEALQKRLMSKVVGNNKKIPFMLFLGDMKQLPPINQSSGFNRGFITMAILNGNKSSKLTQIMRTSDEFFNQIYNSIGNQIEKNIQKRLETPVNETFTPNPYDYTEFLRLIEKPQGNLFVYNTEEAILKDYADELFKTNNPRKAYYSHYNKIDNPYTITVLKKIRDNFMEMIFGTTSHLNHSIPFSQVDDYLDKFGGKNILNEKGISLIKKSELTNIPQFIEIENIRNFIFGDYVQSPDNFPLASSTFTIHSEDINPYALSVMRSIDKQDKGFNLKLDGEVFFDGKGSFKPTSRYRVLDIIQKRYNSKNYFNNIINDFSLSAQFGNSKLAKNINDKRNNPEDVKIDGIYINPEMNLILETILLYTRQDRVRAYSYFMNTYTTYTYEDDGKDEMMNPINARNIFIMRQANTDKIIIKLAIPYRITFQEESGVSYLLNQLGSNQKEFKTSKDRFYSQNVFQKSYLGSSHTTQGDGFEKIYGGISNVLGQQNVKEDAKASSVYTILTRSMKEIAVLNTSSNYSKFSPNDLQSFDELSNDNAPNCNFI